MLFQDDQIKDAAELKTMETEEVETHRQEEQHVDVAVKETLATQVFDKALYRFIDAFIHFHTCLRPHVTFIHSECPSILMPLVLLSFLTMNYLLLLHSLNESEPIQYRIDISASVLCHEHSISLRPI